MVYNMTGITWGGLQTRFILTGQWDYRKLLEEIMETTIGKRITFDAAHRLPLHEGKCSRKHGHTYIVEVDITGEPQREKGSQQGMVLDYYIIKQALEDEVMARFDHRDLNEVLAAAGYKPEEENVSTAERLAGLIMGYLSKRLNTVDPHVTEGWTRVTRVRVQETPNSWAEVRN